MRLTNKPPKDAPTPAGTHFGSSRGGARSIQTQVRVVGVRRQKTKISVVGAGGTVGSTKDDFQNYRAAGKGHEVLRQILAVKPDLATDFELRLKHTWSLLSEDLHPSDWGEIARAIARELTDELPFGIVVTHGTDTLAYTASAISFMFEKLPVPVVFTGSLLPPDYEGSDAPTNIHDSVIVAANTEFAGVFVVFQDSEGKHRYVMPANQTMSISAYGNRFTCLDTQLRGRILPDGVAFSPRARDLLPRRSPPTALSDPRTSIDDRVKILKVYPGLRPDDLVRLAENDTRAIIVQLYHSGTACTRDVSRQALSLVPAIERCRSMGVLVFGLPLDHVETGHVYRSTRMLLDAGMVSIPRMTLEATFTKLVWLLGQHEDPAQVEKLMRTNLRGEVVPGPVA